MTLSQIQKLLVMGLKTISATKKADWHAIQKKLEKFEKTNRKINKKIEKKESETKIQKLLKNL